MMGRAWSCVGIGLALLGCTRPNLAYDGGTEDTELGTQGSPSSSGLATTSATTGSGEVADSASSEGPMESTTTGETTDTSMACLFEEPVRYGIHRDDGSPLGCDGPFEAPDFGLRVFSAEMNSLTGRPCDGCPCNDAGITISLNFEAPLPNIPIPPPEEDPRCLTITRALSDTGCELLGYSIIVDGSGGMGGDELIAAASNELDPGEGVPFVGEFLEPLDECMGTCRGDEPAHYVLELASEMSTIEVYPEAMGSVDDLDVFNVASHVDPNCVEVVRWYALLPP